MSLRNGMVISLSPATDLWPRWRTMKNSKGNKVNYEQFFGQDYDKLCDAMRKTVIEVGCHWPKVKSFRAKASHDLRTLAISTFKQNYSCLVSGGEARQHVLDSRPLTFDEDVDKALSDLITKMHQNDVAGGRRAAAAGVLDHQDTRSKTKSKSLRKPAESLPEFNDCNGQENNQHCPADVSDPALLDPLLTATPEQEQITITRTDGNKKTQYKTTISRKRDGEPKAVSKVISSPTPAISSTPQTATDSVTEYEPTSISSSVYTCSKTSQLSSPIKLVSKRKALPPSMILGQLPLPSFSLLPLPQSSGQGRPQSSYQPPAIMWPTLRSHGHGQLATTKDRLGQYHAGLAMSHLTSAPATMLPPTTGNPTFFAPPPRSAPPTGTTSYVHNSKFPVNSRLGLMPALPAKTSFLCHDAEATLLIRCSNFTWILNALDASRRSSFLASLIIKAPPPPPCAMMEIDLSSETIPTIEAILQHAWNGKYDIGFFVQLPELYLDVFQAAMKYGIKDLAIQACENCITLIERMAARNDVASLIGRITSMYAPQSVHGILEALAEHCTKYIEQYNGNTEFINASIARGSLFGNMVLQAMERMSRRQVEAQEVRSRVEMWTESLP